MAADPMMSKGARMQRAAFLRRLRRRQKYWLAAAARMPARARNFPKAIAAAYTDEIAWVLDMDKRYNRAKGGLGRK